MFRTLMFTLAVAAPALAQRGEEYPADLPPLTTRQPTLVQPRPYSLATEPKYLSPRVDTGLVFPRPPLESDIDMEAVLREFLPSEETLQRDEDRLWPTVQRMQGIWRVEKMMVDGIEILPADFAGTKYLVQGRVIFQSETSEAWDRATWPAPPVVVQGPTVAVKEEYAEPGLQIKRGRPTSTVVMPLGPAAVSRPAGEIRREDPRQEEGVRMNMLYLGDGVARVFWWNRYGESADPHMSRDRPSLRVALPIRGNLVVGNTTMALDVRGVGLRGLLPTKFRRPYNFLAPAGREEETPLEPDRKLSLVLVRDEVVAEPLRETRQNIIPTLRRVPIEYGR
jgi:hypothetical protein